MEMPIIVLAAGASRRMRGIDKLMQPVDGRPLIRRQAEMARSVTSGPVIVALPPPPHPRHDALEGLDVTRLAVEDAAEGINASLRRAFGALPCGVPAAMLLLADLVDLHADDLRKVAGAVDLQSETLVWRGATQTGEPGHPIVFAAPLFPEFARLRGDRGGRAVLAHAGQNIMLVGLPGARARRDLDTQEDWTLWHAQNRDR